MFTKNQLEELIAFHGHLCPGLAMGIRASEIALREVGRRSEDEEIYAVIETDQCAVDAIQFLVGCTVGRGMLIHHDYGKNAYSFYRPRDGKSFRIISKPDAAGTLSLEHQQLWLKQRAKTLTPSENKRFWELQNARARIILSLPLEDVYSFTQATPLEPRLPRTGAFVTCENCFEKVMETRIQHTNGRLLCRTCAQRLEQFTFDVSAEEMTEGGAFKREVMTGSFQPTNDVDYCDPTND